MTSHKNYEHLNLEYIYELADGDDSFIKEIIDTFLTTTPKNLIKLEEAVANRNAADIVFFAHKLKGTFNFIGSTQLSDTFTIIESLSEDVNKYAEITKLLTLIKNTTILIYEDLNDLDASLPNT